MKTFITLIMSVFIYTTAMAQEDTIPGWSSMTKSERKAYERALRDQQIRKEKRMKAMQEAKKAKEEEAERERKLALKPQLPANHWFAGVNAGSGFALADDSWDIFKDIGAASGYNISGYVGYHFNNLIGARLRLRHIRQYSRVNLEVYEAYKNHEVYGKYFPNKGFYGYNGFAAQGEFMLNISRHMSKSHRSPWNVYLLAGTGVNIFYNYDKNVENWKKESGVLPSAWYEVDTNTHTQWMGCLGLLVDFKFAKHFSVNLDITGTVTTDKMEGVKYDEWYEVYLTYGLGVTYHF